MGDIMGLGQGKEFITTLMLLSVAVTGLKKHLLFEWIEKPAPDPVLKFAVTRLSYEDLNLIQDEELKKRAIRIKEKHDCKSSF